MFLNKYGERFVQKAENNEDDVVNSFIFEKLRLDDITETIFDVKLEEIVLNKSH